MKYILLVISVLLFASCVKDQDDDIVDTQFTYVNSTDYLIDINVYVRKQEMVNFKYTVKSHDSLLLDFRSVTDPATPFGAPEVDSAEVVFNNGRRIIYTLEGENGKYKPRNIFFLTTPAYTPIVGDPTRFKFRYEFTNTDYFNAR